MKALRARIGFAGLLAIASCGGGNAESNPAKPPGSEVGSQTGNPTNSGPLDRADLNDLMAQSINTLRSAEVMNMWRAHSGQDTVAVLPIENATTERIASDLDAIRDNAEKWLVQSNVVTVVSRDAPGAAAAKYHLTGRLLAEDQRRDGTRSVRYALLLQLADTRTGAVQWQHQASITKAIR